MLKYRIIRRVVECDGLSEEEAEMIMQQFPKKDNEKLEIEKYPVDSRGNRPWGYERDPSLYE